MVYTYIKIEQSNKCQALYIMVSTKYCDVPDNQVSS